MAKKSDPYDPRLRAAMAEIIDVLLKYDIAGQIVVVSKTHSEFMTHYPKWSVLQFQEDDNENVIGIRFNTNGKEFKSKKEKHECAEATVHMIDQFEHISKEFYDMSHTTMMSLEPYLEIKRPIKRHFVPHSKEYKRIAEALEAKRSH